MKKEIVKTKRIVEKHLHNLVRRMALQEWDIEIIYKDELEKGNKLVGMQNDIDISYLRSTINVFKPMYDRDEAEIIETLTHELAHIITEPLYSLARPNVNPHLEAFLEEQREQATERIARIVKQIHD